MTISSDTIRRERLRASLSAPCPVAEAARAALNARIVAGDIRRTVAPNGYALVYWGTAVDGQQWGLADWADSYDVCAGGGRDARYIIRSPRGTDYDYGRNYERALRHFERLTRH